MKTRILSLSCALVLLVTSATNGDEPVTPPVISGIVVPTPPQPLPQPTAAIDTERQSSTVEHLRRAADHLEAAGAADLAREIREEADALLEGSLEQLNQKREQLARLQREIADLEILTGFEQQVMLTCRVIEINMTRIRQLGVETSFLQGDKAESSNSLPTGINNAETTESFIDALVVQGLAKVLGEPVLVTTSGRPAIMHSGGEFPILVPAGTDEATIEWRNFGLMLEAVPVVLGGGKVRVELTLELAIRDFSNAVTVGDTVVPGLTVRRLNTQVELQFGETATIFMDGWSRAETIQQTSDEEGAGEDSHVVTVICVTPEAVRAAIAE